MFWQNRRKYKVLLHVAGWLLFLSWPFLFDSHDPNRQPRTLSFWIPIITGNLILLGLFYLNLLVLIPSILRKRGWSFYLGAVLICFFAYAFVSSELRKQFPPRRFNREIQARKDDPAFKSDDRNFRRDRPVGTDGFRFMYFFSIVPFLLVLGLSTSLKFSEDIANFEKERKEKENENLKSELALLRSQISPHFMFNVLNSLAAMARKKSEHIEEAIINLSQLMRYMLYESSIEKTTLGEELEYLNNYIDLQRLRFGSLVSVVIERGNTNLQLPIEPMLLIPFVENAFKHGVGMVNQPEILITVSTSGQSIDFQVKNKVGNLQQEKDHTPGIGLQNVKRRLELLYSNKFSLKTGQENGWFDAHLVIMATV
jgi:two-component system, LytTR family, sensor kinase